MTITTKEAERIAEDATQALSAASTSRPRYSPGAGGLDADEARDREKGEE